MVLAKRQTTLTLFQLPRQSDRHRIAVIEDDWFAIFRGFAALKEPNSVDAFHFAPLTLFSRQGCKTRATAEATALEA